MVILGINGGVRLGYQDISAVLMIDGKIIAAVEEERLNRIKFSPGQISEKSINEVLRIAKISINDVDIVATHGSTWGDEYYQVLNKFFLHNFGYCPKIERIHHHDAHAASTFFASGFNESLVITIDFSGDGVSMQVAKGTTKGLEVIDRIERPNSLGLFYSLVSQYCGFVRDSDEYKLMGLSSYGKGDSFDWNWLLNYKEGEYILNSDYVMGMRDGEPSPTRQQMLFNNHFLEKMAMPKRLSKEPITDYYKNVAASAQYQYEKVLMDIVKHYQKQTGIKKLCLAGGGALNCVANQKLMNSDFIDEIYVQPASGDSGISLGAAYFVAHQNNEKVEKMDMPYLGSLFTNEEIKWALDITQTKYTKIENPSFKAADLVNQGKVIGWFQGSAEFGPRALGNRSILANPTIKGMNDLVNEKIKFRESYRPFCPSVLEEDAHLFFMGKQTIAPTMTITYDVKKEMINKIPAVVHVDNTARIQTVNRNQNELFYNFLIDLKKLNGIGMAMNTSFNKKDEPIVNSPIDALATYHSCGLDALIIGNYLLIKN